MMACVSTAVIVKTSGTRTSVTVLKDEAARTAIRVGGCDAHACSWMHRAHKFVILNQALIG